MKTLKAQLEVKTQDYEENSQLEERRRNLEEENQSMEGGGGEAAPKGQPSKQANLTGKI